MKFTITETYNDAGVPSDRRDVLDVMTLEEFLAWCRGQNEKVIVTCLANGEHELEIYNGYRE